MSYKKAIEVLEALPEDQKIMIRRYYNDHNGRHCAIGHLVRVKPEHETGIRILLDPRRYVSQVPSINTKYIKDRLDELAMTEDEAARLQEYVDDAGWRESAAEGRPLFDAALNFMREQEGL